jgi:hypothetical protein
MQIIELTLIITPSAKKEPFHLRILAQGVNELIGQTIKLNYYTGVPGKALLSAYREQS